MAKRKPAKPTVKRGAGGKIESLRRPIAPVAGEQDTPKPVVSPAPTKRKKTRSGKVLDRATGRIAVPSVKQGAGGKIQALSAEEKAAKVRTELPAAGREVMSPAQAAPLGHVQGTLKRGGSRETGSNKGASVSYPVIKKAADAALEHLNKAHFSIGAGMNPQEHFNTFDAIHSNIATMDKPLHTSLGAAKHLISVSAGKTTPLLRQTHEVIHGRLNDLKDVHESNIRRAMEGRERKQGQ